MAPKTSMRIPRGNLPGSEKKTMNADPAAANAVLTPCLVPRAGPRKAVSN